MARTVSMFFNGEKYRLIQSFPTKAMAQSYAKGLRKRGLSGQGVKVRMTTGSGAYSYKVWVRGK